MFKKLRTVIYHVQDLAKAKEWYMQVMGIEPYFDESFYVGFDIDGCELGLDPDITGVIKGNQSVAYWAVDSVGDVVAKLIKSGAKIAQPRANVGGDIYTAILNDPFGNSIGIIEGA